MSKKSKTGRGHGRRKHVYKKQFLLIRVKLRIAKHKDGSMESAAVPKKHNVIPVFFLSDCDFRCMPAPAHVIEPDGAASSA